jgi:hypothetical protein
MDFGFFGDPFGEDTIARLARALGRQWGQGAMKTGTDTAPTDWQKFLLVRAGFFFDVRAYLEAIFEQFFPDTAEYEVERWEHNEGVPPPPPGTLLGDRLARLLAYCQAIHGSRPADIVEALSSLAHAVIGMIQEKRAVDCWAGQPERIFEFYTLVDAATADDVNLRTAINAIVDRWKPAHTMHGSSEGPSGPGPYGGVRVGTSSGPTWFKTGAGPEKTGRNLIRYN